MKYTKWFKRSFMIGMGVYCLWMIFGVNWHKVACENAKEYDAENDYQGARPHLNLGKALAVQGDKARAEGNYQLATNLYGQAWTQYQMALSYPPDPSKVWRYRTHMGLYQLAILRGDPRAQTNHMAHCERIWEERDR